MKKISGDYFNYLLFFKLYLSNLINLYVHRSNLVDMKTYLTLVWSLFIIEVNPGVFPHVIRAGKHLTTSLAGKWPLGAVTLHMFPHGAGVTECHATNLTTEWLLSCQDLPLF